MISLRSSPRSKHSSRQMPERITPLPPICAGPPGTASRTTRRSSRIATTWSCSRVTTTRWRAIWPGASAVPGSVHPIRVADLESVHVYPAHRNRGVGEQLATAFLAWAVEKGAQRATVTAYAANDGARRFYARHGFAVRSVTLDLDLPRKPSATRPPDHG